MEPPSRSDSRSPPSLRTYSRCVAGMVFMKFLSFLILGLAAQFWSARRGVLVILSTENILNFGCSFAEIGVPFRSHCMTCIGELSISWCLWEFVGLQVFL